MHVNSDKSTVVDQREEVMPVAVPTEPPMTMPPPLVQAPVVQAPVVQAATVQTVRTTTVVPAAIIAGIIGVALLVLGGITAARAGLDGALDEPIVTVAGYTATALLGLIELGFGLFLVIAALSRMQSTILFFGIAGFVAALVAVFQPTVGGGALAIERGLALWFTVAMIAVVVSALLPTVRRRSSTHRVLDVD